MVSTHAEEHPAANEDHLGYGIWLVGESAVLPLEVLYRRGYPATILKPWDELLSVRLFQQWRHSPRLRQIR